MMYVLLIGLILGLIMYFFASKNQSVIGYRGVTFLIYGYSTWKISNYLAGLFVIAVTLVSGGLYYFSSISNTLMLKIYIIMVLLSFLTSDAIVIYQRKAKRIHK